MFTKSNYKKYLRSKEWIEVRKKAIKRDKGKCKLCGSKKSIQVHHLNYQHVFYERFYLDDLLTVCDICHKKIHEFRKKLQNKKKNKTKTRRK